MLTALRLRNTGFNLRQRRCFQLVGGKPVRDHVLVAVVLLTSQVHLFFLVTFRGFQTQTDLWKTVLTLNYIDDFLLKEKPVRSGPNK